jgi:hypothetical protein
VATDIRDLAQFIRDGELIVSRLAEDETATPELIARAERVLSQAKDELANQALK